MWKQSLEKILILKGERFTTGGGGAGNVKGWKQTDSNKGLMLIEAESRQRSHSGEEFPGSRSCEALDSFHSNLAWGCVLAHSLEKKKKIYLQVLSIWDWHFCRIVKPCVILFFNWTIFLQESVQILSPDPPHSVLWFKPLDLFSRGWSKETGEGMV